MSSHPLRLALCFLITILAPHIVGAWGSGHDDVARAIFERLPEALLSKFTPEQIDDAIKRSSHYPDSFDPFLESEIGEAAIVALHEAEIKRRYDLHSNRGRVASFARLVDALRDEDHPKYLAHWIASHSHVIADMAACNHDPLVHQAVYGWAPWKVPLPHRDDFSKIAGLLDLSYTARNQEGGAEVYSQAVDRALLNDDGRDLSQQIQEILLYGQEGARYCSARGVKILEGAAAWIDREDESGRALLWEQISELGAWAVVRTLRDIEVAQRFAREGIEVKLSPEDLIANEGLVDQFLRDHDLKDELLYAPILRPLGKSEGPVIGVILEPTWNMNEAMFGFSSRVYNTSIARTLAKQEMGYATFDVRDLVTGAFPSPTQVPLLIVSAMSFHNYHWIKAEDFDAGLNTYVNNGGKVIWIGGTGAVPKTTFASIAAARKRVDKENLPVAVESFVGAQLSIQIPEEPSWTVINTPQTPAGWQRPYCPWWFEQLEEFDLEPLVTLQADRKTFIVGVASKNRQLAYLPIYALTPHLLDASTPIISPSEPELDAPTTEILIGTIQQLLSE